MLSIQRLISLVFIISLLSGCASYDYPSQVKLGDTMVEASGESLEGKAVSIPSDFKGEQTVLLFGYVQDSQFDIDRWLIGLDMTQTKVNVYEIPTIQGMLPRMFSTFIDGGMRKGIPKQLWKGVVTVYADGDKVQRYTGNQNPNNSRVMLLDEQGKVLYFYDSGFSVEALNELRALIKS
jgi:cytochrome oxidase Cu insertion factor (SCO1/SenC/PrrC family)